MFVIKKILSHELMKASILYGIADLIKRLIPFLLLPIMTAYLSPEDYGILSLYGTFLAIFSILASAGAIGSVGREYFDKDQKSFASFVSNCIVIILISSVITFLVAATAKELISEVFSIPQSFLWTVFIIATITNLFQVMTVIFQAQKKPLLYGAAIVIFYATEVFLSLYLVVSCGMNWEGRVYSQVITSLIFLIPIFAVLARKNLLVAKANKQDIKLALSFGIPLMPHLFAGIMISMTDRLLLAHMLNNDAVGLYAVGTQVGLVISVAVYAFNQAWAPWLFGNLKKDDLAINRHIVKITHLYFALILIGSLLYSAFAYLIFYFMIDSRYMAAYQVAIIISISGAFTGMYYMVGGYITYARKTKIHSYITFVVGVTNLLLSYILIIYFGMIGAALGTLVANIVAFLATWVYASRVHKMPWIL